MGLLTDLNYHQMQIDNKPLICRMLSCYNFKEEQIIMKVLNLQILKCKVQLGQAIFNQVNLQPKEDGKLQNNN